MHLTFYGAVRTVTGSMHVLDVKGHRILLDCGLFQGRRAESYERNKNFPFDPRTIDTVVLSHAHIDHSGNLPSLVKHGFRGDILCTAATRDLAAVMLRDSADIQVSDTDFVNKIRAQQGEEPVEPLYTPEEAERTIDLLVGHGYEHRIKVAPSVELTFHDAGHILGAAISVFDLKEGQRSVRFAFTGDLGRRNTPILKDPAVVTGIDYLITESTYASREHEPMAVAESRLARLINRTVSRGGHVIIPAFAVERTQELVYALHRQRLARTLADVPIFVDSPLAVDATDVFRLHPECFDRETVEFMKTAEDPFGFHRLHYVRSVQESKRLNRMQDPFVVIAGSGMCESGRVLHHLRRDIEDRATTVILVGFQAENTLGRKLQNGHDWVRIFGEGFRVRADIETINGFSAHADRNDLLWWIGQAANKAQHIFIVHGEEETSQALVAELGEKGIAPASVPEPGQRVEL